LSIGYVISIYYVHCTGCIQRTPNHLHFAVIPVYFYTEESAFFCCQPEVERFNTPVVWRKVRALQVQPTIVGSTLSYG
jgi:hypothetical protein